MLSSILPFSPDTSAMQSGAPALAALNSPSHDSPDTHTKRTEAVYAVCVLAAGVLLLFTAL